MVGAEIVERGGATRERIIGAAISLFMREGYAAVSVDAICAAARATKGSFYHAFASKEALVLAAIERTWRINKAEIEAIYASDLPLQDRFRRHLEWFGTSQRRLKEEVGFVPGPLNIALDLGVPPSVAELNKRAVAEHAAIVHAAAEQLLQPRGESRAVIDWITGVIQALLSGANINARLSNSLEPFDLLPDTVLALMQLAPPPVGGVARQSD